MTETTTVRVARATRDHLNKITAETGETVDTTIQRALELVEREKWRREAERDAWLASQDEQDKAEVRAAIAEALGE